MENEVKIIFDETHVCENCKKWYLNDNNGKECSWNNNDVPKRKDFCSRWEPKEQK